MNTTKKGNEFETLSVSIVEEAIKKGDLVLPVRYELFKKKGYYSKTREKEIIFDLSLEIKSPNSDKYQLLYLIECKSYYPRSIPVDDIVVFDSYINQVAPRNAKGILITDGDLQESAFKSAQSQGIMVIKVTQEKDYKIVLYKNSRVDVFDEKFEEKNEITQKVETFFSEIFLPDEERILGFSYHSRNSIEEIAENIIKEYDASLLETFDAKLDVKKFIQYIEDKYNVKTKSIPLLQFVNGKKILGFFDNENKMIYIDNGLFVRNKYYFVFFHEFGHFILHSNLKMNQSTYNGFKDSEYSIVLGRYELTNIKHWIEWQANQFSASILLPRNNLEMLLCYFQHEIGILRNIGKLYIDDQPVNIQDSALLLRKLALHYGVSISTIKYRLNALGLIIDNRKKMDIFANLYRRR